jgi:hypothetical protein
MESSQSTYNDSNFIARNTHLLIDRFALSYRHEFSCVDYYISDIQTGLCISKDILFTRDRLEKRLVVSRFYPELHKQPDSKYLSATSFYLMIHHFLKINQIPSRYAIYLSARPGVFRAFYEKLKDFSFHVQGSQTTEYLDVFSALEDVQVDTSMITRAADR